MLHALGPHRGNIILSRQPSLAHAHLGGTGGDGVTQTMERGFSPDVRTAARDVKEPARQYRE